MALSREEQFNILRGLDPKPQIQPQAKKLSRDQQLDVLKNLSNSIPAPEEYTYAQRALQPVAGAASTYGSIFDIASKPSSAQELQAQLHEKHGGKRLEFPSMEEKLPGIISGLAGKNLVPTEEDTTGKILYGTGQIGAPLGIPGGGIIGAGVKGGLKAAGKEAIKEGSMALGASTALQTPHITEEGSGARFVEDTIKALGGGIAGVKTAGKVGALPGQLKGAASNIPEKILSVWSNPNQKVLDYAKKHNINLPFNVGMGSKIQNYLANNTFKSFFTNDVWKKTLETANKDMLGAVNKSLDTLGDVNYKPSEASTKFASFLEKEKDVAKKQSTELYDAAASFANPKDTVATKHISDFFDSPGIQELLSADIHSVPSKKTVEVLTHLGHKWGIIPKAEIAKILEDSPSHLLPYLASFKQHVKEMPISKLISARKQLGQMVNYEPEAKGAKNFLNGLRKAITNDIDTTSNKAFLEKWKTANKFEKDVMTDLYRTDLSQSLLKGEAPTLAFDEMNSIDGIEAIRKLAGNSEKGQELFNSLKKAKARDLLGKSVTEEGVQYGQYANLFKGKEKNLEVLEHLIGKKEYKNLKEVSKIAEEITKSGRDFLNPSGTSISAFDHATFLAMGSILMGQTLPAASGAVRAGSINLASRLLTNPNVVNKMRAYALNKQKGNEKYAETLLNQIHSIMKKQSHVPVNVGVKALAEKENSEKNE